MRYLYNLYRYSNLITRELLKTNGLLQLKPRTFYHQSRLEQIQPWIFSVIKRLSFLLLSIWVIMSKIFFDILFLGQQSNKNCNNKQNNLSQDFLQEARKGLIAERDITRYKVFQTENQTYPTRNIQSRSGQGSEKHIRNISNVRYQM